MKDSNGFDLKELDQVLVDGYSPAGTITCIDYSTNKITVQFIDYTVICGSRMLTKITPGPAHVPTFPPIKYPGNPLLPTSSFFKIGDRVYSKDGRGTVVGFGSRDAIYVKFDDRPSTLATARYATELSLIPQSSAPPGMLPSGPPLSEHKTAFHQTVAEMVTQEHTSGSPAKCECGAHSIGMNFHADYCPLFEKQ